MKLAALILLCAAPLWADFAAEPVLDLIAGRIEREPAAHWQAMHDRARGWTDETRFDRELEMARALDQLNRHKQALDLIEPWTGMPLSGSQQRELSEVRILVALHACWRGGVEGYDANICLLIAREAAGVLGFADTPLTPAQQVMLRVVKWFTDAKPAESDSLLRDFFNLRFTSGHTVEAPTGELARLELAAAEQGLLDLLRLHPLWENVDTFHTLNLVYAVEGRQVMAFYTRLRVQDLLRQGGQSRVPGATGNPSLTTKDMVTDSERAMATTQFNARRDYAKRWLSARESYAATRAYQSDFWADFKVPAFEAPSFDPPAAPPAAPAPAQAEAEPGQGASLPMALGALWVLLVLLAVGFAVKSRIPDEKPPADGDKA